MDTGAPIDSLVFVTKDEKRDRGGEWIEINNCHCREFITGAEKKKLAKAQPKSNLVKRDPRHYENSTRNVVLQNGELRKFHIRLLRRFNGKVIL